MIGFVDTMLAFVIGRLNFIRLGFNLSKPFDASQEANASCFMVSSATSLTLISPRGDLQHGYMLITVVDIMCHVATKKTLIAFIKAQCAALICNNSTRRLQLLEYWR
ncbi:hypothetical protein O0I10_007003 [Lichtheimia ornata]|uniref:Uncharacterized protein n=1 Tax=Lichtheimia ornata TaxID=688661 RepID=A0AAD7Y0H2_9FUNG|nr:uncharacterized protein O0I10_007003 [Lichtheimia ornata]KAJ8657187.1 hypothetical protein O0I10_007003 [Lichtheimia ornata]